MRFRIVRKEVAPHAVKVMPVLPQASNDLQNQKLTALENPYGRYYSTARIPEDIKKSKHKV
jgi:hypothetical protein